jgi:WD40 repeat protein
LSLWDVGRRRWIRTGRADVGTVASVAFSPDGRMLLTATEARPPRLWDVATGRLLHQVGGVPQDAWAAWPGWAGAAFSPDGSFISTGSAEAIAILDGRPIND